MDLRMFDFDAAIAIQAPANAVAMPIQAAPARHMGSVRNGGNVREQPNLGGRVLDQINANETVQLLAQTAGGAWYQITNIRSITGWVSASLLTVAPEVAAQVPQASARGTSAPAAPAPSAQTPASWTTHQIDQLQLALPETWQKLDLEGVDLNDLADQLEAENPQLAQAFRRFIQSGQKIEFFAIDIAADCTCTYAASVILAPGGSADLAAPMQSEITRSLRKARPDLTISKSEIRTIHGLTVVWVAYTGPVNQNGRPVSRSGAQFYILGGPTTYVVTLDGEPGTTFDLLAEQIGASLRLGGTATSRVRNGGNLRSAPRVTPATVIGQVCPDDRVTILDSQTIGGARWDRVRVDSSAQSCHPARVAVGTEGWVSSTLLDPPQAPAP